MQPTRVLKDEALDRLAAEYNVAQFASFSPGDDPKLRHVRLAIPALGQPRIKDVIALLLAASASGSVNVRSFLPDRDKGCPFRYGIRDVSGVLGVVRQLSAEGYYTIVNETIDVEDGGVSGVCLGGVVEFAPDGTPRAVELEGVASTPYELGLAILTSAYGFTPKLVDDSDARLEFSIHPGRVGYRKTHTIYWEIEHINGAALKARHVWPNKFSRHIGDKAYGLLVAHHLGLAVPRTMVVGRRVAPFTFGTSTDTGEVWLRTCPTEQAPGRYTTLPRWTDPYALLAEEDPSGRFIQSVLSQDAVDAAWSGATLPAQGSTDDFVQGVAGSGDAFMQGAAAPTELPENVVADVQRLAQTARAALGDVRMEWVHDGQQAWVVQLHISSDYFAGHDVLNPGEASQWVDYYVSDGLERLRAILPQAVELGAGIRVHGAIGLTSHVGDLIRRSRVPGRFAPSGDM